MSGKTIRLFLIDGRPQGLRTAEVGNWTGLALVCPRTELAKLSQRETVHGTGVYILVGPSEASPSGMAVYVGEGDDVWTRLSSHDLLKDFWTWVTVFVSKDENLTKAHVRCLEARLIEDIRRAKRAELKNTATPTGGKLPEPDLADMDAFYENVRLLLPALGVNVFASEAPTTTVTDGPQEPVFELNWQEAHGECVIRDGQYVVLEGSTARVTEVDSLGASGRALRERLRGSGILQADARNPQLLCFAQDYPFDSPSAAAAAVAGTGLNGRAHWKLKGTGQTLKEWQSSEVEPTVGGSEDE